MDPFGAFFDVMLRDMLGTIPGGEEFLASLLGMAGRSGAVFPGLESGTLLRACACRRSRQLRLTYVLPSTCLTCLTCSHVQPEYTMCRLRLKRVAESRLE